MKAAAVIGSTCLAIALAVTAGAAARPEASSITLRTALSAGQEVPAPTGDVSAARGSFTATVTRSDSGASITWELTFSGLTGNAGAAHIHQAATGTPGPVVLALCGPCQSGQTGTATLSDAALTAIESGNAYVNVHTPTNAPGEIRGQLGITANSTTALSSRQERPKPKGNVKRASGTFVATVTRSGASGRIAWRLRFSKLTGQAGSAHIHIGPRGTSGPVAVSLCGPCRSGARGTSNVTSAVLAALESGRAYVNVHTARNPAGEIRGQIRALSLSLD